MLSENLSSGERISPKISSLNGEGLAISLIFVSSLGRALGYSA